MCETDRHRRAAAVPADRKACRLRCIPSILLAVLLPALCQAQTTARISPAELVKIPSTAVTDAPYWHQLVVTLGSDVAASDAAMTVALPPAILVPDTNGDTRFSDEVRVLYDPVAEEAPSLFVSQQSTADTIVVGSARAAAEGGIIYLQFPVLARPLADIGTPSAYTSIKFAAVGEAAADSVSSVPQVEIVEAAGFDLQGSMNVVVLEQPLVAGSDTVAVGLGTYYPEVAELLLQDLPDLVFDNGLSHANNLLGFGDGDDTNDVTYSFFWSTDSGLRKVEEDTAQPVLLDNGATYLENEGAARSVRLLTRDLTEGTYYLYAVSSVTGATPLARSRGLVIKHEPLIQALGPGSTITLDSGGLFDLTGEPTGKGVSRFEFDFAITDHDDDATMHLFVSDNPDLNQENIALNVAGDVASLIGALPITPPTGVTEESGSASWHITESGVVTAGTYHIYGVAEDGRNQTLLRGDHQVQVRHSPFLRLDALVDDLLSAPDTVVTGGPRPQRHLTVTWGRAGIDGDMDIDDDAAISLYYSAMPASPVSAMDSLQVPGGHSQLAAELAAEEGRVRLMVAGIAENPDARSDNQAVWNLWSLTGEGVPLAGETYYLYGVAEDDTSGWLAQLNGGRLNDLNSKVVFAHPPFIRALQPTADVVLAPGVSTVATWEDMDLDDDAAIRVVLTPDSLGIVTDYAALSSTTAFVVNSADGRAAPEVDRSFDLSEDDSSDALDIGFTHLQRSLGQDQPPAEGAYFVYLTIEEGERFDEGSMAWQAPGKVVLAAGEAGDGESFRLFPQVFSLGVGGLSQSFELRVDAEEASVDLVVARLRLDGQSLSVVDQNEELEGVQPFTVAPGFSANQLFVNEMAQDGDDLELALAYLDPEEIVGLDGDGAFATFVVQSLATVGDVSVELLADPTATQFSHLEFRGAVIETPDADTLATGTLIDGRRLSGRLLLEGRIDMTAEVDFSLQEWASFAPLADSAFAAENDVNLDREGVQVALASDGSFALVNVPAGQLDLFAHLDGYLDAWAPGLVVTATENLADLNPTSTGVAGDSLMLAGDVAGYTGADGRTRPDNEVTLADWDYLSSLFGRTIASDHDSVRADINRDGEVSLPDLALITANFRSHGPRPVYKPVAGSDLPSSQTPALFGSGLGVEQVVSGEIVTLEVRGRGLEGVRAMDLSVEFDPAGWTCAGVTEYGVRRTGLVLTADKIDMGSCRSAMSRVGRDEDFANASSLLTWSLRAREDQPQPPRLRPIMLLDRRDRVVEVAQSDIHFGAASSRLPASHALGQNFPNPFNPRTTIPFVVGFGGGEWGQTAVRLEVFDILGRSVGLLWNEPLIAGSYTMHWDGRDAGGQQVASGVYLYRLRIGATQRVKRMLLVR